MVSFRKRQKFDWKAMMCWELAFLERLDWDVSLEI
jgi:hypothetical protein